MPADYDFENESPRRTAPAIVAISSALVLFLSLTVLLIAIAHHNQAKDREAESERKPVLDQGSRQSSQVRDSPQSTYIVRAPQAAQWSYSDLIRHLRTNGLAFEVSDRIVTYREQPEGLWLSLIRPEEREEITQLESQLRTMQEEERSELSKEHDAARRNEQRDELISLRRHPDQRLINDVLRREREAAQARMNEISRRWAKKREPIESRLKALTDRITTVDLVKCDSHDAALVRYRSWKEHLELQHDSSRMDDHFLVWCKFIFQGSPMSLGQVRRALP
jgi:hypothetical protein